MERFDVLGDLNSGNCLKIKFTSDHLGFSYRWIHVDIMKGETKTKEFLKLNPVGQVPVVLFADGKVLSQSNAIIKYLAKDSSLVGKDDFERAKIDEWLFWEQYSHEPAIAVLRFQRVYKGIPFSELDPLLIDRSKNALKIMEDHLKQNRYLVGDRLTVADISLFAYTNLAPQAGLNLEDYPCVQMWLGRCKKDLNLS